VHGATEIYVIKKLLSLIGNELPSYGFL